MLKIPKDEAFMREAIEQARAAERTAGASPIGCVVVRDGTVLARAVNEVEGRGDPTAHAEILAIQRACASEGTAELRGATLYSTLQPCGMCTMAAIWAKVERVVYGAGREDVHRMYFEDRHLDCADFARDAFRDDMSIVAGICRHDCAELYPEPDDAIPVAEQANL